MDSTSHSSDLAYSNKSTVYFDSNDAQLENEATLFKDNGTKGEAFTSTSLSGYIGDAKQQSDLTFDKPLQKQSKGEPSASVCDTPSVMYASSGIDESILGKIYNSQIYNEKPSAMQLFEHNKSAPLSEEILNENEKVIGYTSRVGEERIISETIEERQIKVPKRIVHQDNYERIVTINESVLREEIVDALHTIREKVVKFARPVTREKLVEVNTIEYSEVPVERLQKITQERVKHVPLIEHRKRDVQVPKYITKERVVEVPQIEYREVPVEKIVEVSEIKERFVIKPVPVPQYVDKPVPQEVIVEKLVEVDRGIPEPLEVISTVEYLLPQMIPKTQVVKYPLYIPRFMEVPVPAELFTDAEIEVMKNEVQKLKALNGPRAIGLRELEQLTEGCRAAIDMASSRMTPKNYEAALAEAWKNGHLNIQNCTSMPRNDGFVTRENASFRLQSTPAV